MTFSSSRNLYGKNSIGPNYPENLIDLDLDKAIELINKSGLLLGNIIYLSDSINYKNKVVGQTLFLPSRITDKINLEIE